MQTNFSLAQLADPAIADANSILRACVHCGFCTATCPTYVLLGDELDSPRGRIYLIKNMLEGGGPATPETVKHVDRCLSCLSCMSTCPSGVNYMHLVDTARIHIEKTHHAAPRRPVAAQAAWPMSCRALACSDCHSSARGWRLHSGHCWARALRRCWRSHPKPCLGQRHLDRRAHTNRRHRRKPAWPCSWAVCRACSTPASMPQPSGF